MDQCIREGGRNAAELYRGLAGRGCRSSACSVGRFLNRQMAAGVRRARANAATPSPPPPPTVRRLSYEFLRRPADRSAVEQGHLNRVRTRDAGLRAGLDLAEEFAAMLRRVSATALTDWMGRAVRSGCPELRGFVEGLRQDEAAVAAALTGDWSNGPVEGQVNRLKTIKRPMYGRAGFRLLRARVRYKP